jgi:hypothetical protein
MGLGEAVDGITWGGWSPTVLANSSFGAVRLDVRDLRNPVDARH